MLLRLKWIRQNVTEPKNVGSLKMTPISWKGSWTTYTDGSNPESPIHSSKGGTFGTFL